MRHLRVDGEEELVALKRALRAALSGTATAYLPAEVEALARLQERLEARLDVPTLAEEAGGSLGGPARCDNRVLDRHGLSATGKRTCGLALSTDGTCPGMSAHVGRHP